MSLLFPYILMPFIFSALPISTTGGPLELTAKRLELSLMPKAERCPVLDEREVQSPNCQAAFKIVGTELTLSGDNLAISADRASLRETPRGILKGTLEGVKFTRCRCGDEPWSVTSESGDLEGESLLLRWPVFLWHGVPIAAAPIWPIPTQPRASGLTFPNLGWNAASGAYGEQGFFWAIHEQIDLSPSIGYAETLGTFGTLQSRWQNAEYRLSTLNIEAQSGGVRSHGRGHLAISTIGVGFDGEVNTSTVMRRQRVRHWQEAVQQHTFGQAGFSVSQRRWNFSISEVMVENHDENESSIARSGVHGARLGFQPHLGDLLFNIDGTFQEEWREGHSLTRTLEADVEFSHPQWFGPFRFDTRGGLRGVAQRQPASPMLQAGGAFASVSGELYARKMLSPRLEHRFGLRTRTLGQWIKGDSISAPRDQWHLRPRRFQGLAIVENRVTGRAIEGRISLHALSIDSGSQTAPLGLEGRLTSPLIRAQGYLRDSVFSTVHVGLGPDTGLNVQGVWTRKNRNEHPRYWLPLSQLRPVAVSQPIGQAAESVSFGAFIPMGQLALRWYGVLDSNERLVTQNSAAIWQGDCHCWHMRLEVWTMVENKMPNVAFNLELAAAELL